MIVRRESVGEYAVFHHDEREAVGEAPLFVGPFSKEGERSRVQPLGGRDYLDLLVALHCVEQLDGGPAVALPCEGVADLQNDRSRRDELRPFGFELLREFFRPRMMVVVGGGEGYGIGGVEENLAPQSSPLEP